MAAFGRALYDRERGFSATGRNRRSLQAPFVSKFSAETVLEHGCTVSAIDWSQDGSYIVSSGDDFKLRLWNLSSSSASPSVAFDSVRTLQETARRTADSILVNYAACCISQEST
jgi:WD40 repeat protein